MKHRPPAEFVGTASESSLPPDSGCRGNSLSWWLFARQFETTDDAQVDGHFAQLSARVTGTVLYVNPMVENDRLLTAGTELVRLDPRDYQADLDHAHATLDTKQAEADAAGLQVPITQATALSRLHVAEAEEKAAVETVAEAEAASDAARKRVQQETTHRGACRARPVPLRSSRREARDLTIVLRCAGNRSENRKGRARGRSGCRSRSRRRVAESQRTVAQRQAEIDAAQTAPQQISDARAKANSANGALEQARADLHTAELNLSYTTISAPVSGVIGHKTVEVGNRIQPGQSLLTIVPVDDIWVTANFKETQLRRMHPGEPVTIHVDSLGRNYSGSVEDMAGASGPLFSLFPPENASGNYVQDRAALSNPDSHSILARIPKINFAPECRWKPEYVSADREGTAKDLL